MKKIIITGIILLLFLGYAPYQELNDLAVVDFMALDFKDNNLHVVGYSLPVNKKVNLEELKTIIYTQPEQPDAIPYVTSYYKERYGFCMTQNQKNNLKEDNYHFY